MEKIKSIPFILLISGVPCVGKTTISYKLLEEYPFFKRITELDMIKTVIRSIIKENDCSYPNNEFNCLFCSTTDSNYDIFKQQAIILSRYVKEIVIRQKKRCIPTIIEGINIIPSVYFNNSIPIEGFKDNVLFVNLYISNEQEHIKRRFQRCKERNYTMNDEQIKEKIFKYKDKNLILHQETLKLANKVNNVFSIDISGMSQASIVHAIKDIINDYLKSLFDE